MDEMKSDDLGLTEQELDEKQEAAYQESVARLLELMRAIDSCEQDSKSAVAPVAMVGLLIISATRIVQSLRSGITEQMDRMAGEKLRPEFLLAAMDSRRAFVQLEDELIELFRTRLPECLGGATTKGTYTVVTAINDALRQGGWLKESDDAEK